MPAGTDAPTKSECEVLHNVRQERSVIGEELLGDELVRVWILGLIVGHGPQICKQDSTCETCPSVISQR